MAKINPFKPNYPISPGMFVGRLSEIERLETHLLQTRAGNPSNFMITGERGIGKSSLLNYFKFVAQGDLNINGYKVNFLVIDTDIDQNTTQLGLVKKIELCLRRELGKTEPARMFLKDMWNFLKRVEAQGIKLAPECSVEDEGLMIEEFSYSLAEIAKRICSDTEGMFNAQYDGIIILIDEADNSSKSLGLGSFFKLLTERLQRRGCNRLMVGLAGLSSLREVLMTSHESSLRSFDEITLDRLKNDEVSDVIDIAIEQANKENPTPYEITPEARALLIGLSEGYPHFIQQFGYSAFSFDQDNKIDDKDVSKGAIGKGGAINLIGDRYYRNDFYNKIQKESYRQVLRIMADHLDSWVTKKNIRERFKGKESTLDNAIKALRDRHIIFSKEGEQGVYRLQHRGFALWIKFYTTDPDKLQHAIEFDDPGKEA